MRKFNVYDRSGKVTSQTTYDFVIGLLSRLEATPYKDGIQLTFTSSVKREFKQSIIKRDNNKCYICNCDVSDDGTVDHVISKNNNGPFAKYNLRCCCEDCNKDKSSMNLDTYIEYLISIRHQYDWLTDERIDALYDTWSDVIIAHQAKESIINDHILEFKMVT